MNVFHTLPLVLLAPVAAQSEAASLRGRLVRPGDSCPIAVSGPSAGAPLGEIDASGRRTGSFGSGAAAMPIALEFKADDQPIALFLDSDRDGSFDDETPVRAEPARSEVPSNAGMVTMISWAPPDDVTIGASTYKVRVSRIAGSGKPSVSFRCTGTTYVHAEGDIGGVPYHIVVADWDGDGKWGSKGDYWRALDTSATEFVRKHQATKKGRGLNNDSMIEAFEPVYLGDGRVLELAAVGDDFTVRVKLENAEDTVEEYLLRRNERVAERWKNTFNDQFVKTYGEPERPKTDKPIQWLHALDFEEARAIAADRGVPILADFETDWCVWCKALDQLTYEDDAIAAYVNANFVPVKLNAELLVEPLAKRYGVGGFPSMPVIAANGDKVAMLGGYSKPSAFLAKLKEAKAKFDAKDR